MDGHRTYEVIRRRLIHEAVTVVAPNELVAKRIALNLNVWREAKSEEEAVVSVKPVEPK